MSALLQVGPLGGVRGGRVALFAEFVANPETAPYLVSSTRSLLWVERLSTRRLIRAAFRKDLSPEQAFADIVSYVESEGVRREWGNIHPLTVEGIQAAVGHLNYFDIDEVELLVGDGVSDDLLGSFGADSVLAPWLPKEMVVAVPKDRSFLGFFGHAGVGYSIVVVHNASRGMAIARVSS